jgi:hypothetical protein
VRLHPDSDKRDGHTHADEDPDQNALRNQDAHQDADENPEQHADENSL